MQQNSVEQLAKHLQHFAGQVTQTFGVAQSQLNMLRRRIAAVEAREKLAAAGRKPAFPVEFRSQFGEDATIWELLGGQLDGFYIECGAFDGYNSAVTYCLEAMGWKGLLVEAMPKCCEECRQRRPGSRVVNAALSKRGSSGTANFTVTDDQYGGMLSFLDKNSSHAQSVRQQSIRTREVTVPLTTMNDLLKDHTGPIDAAVIDVEGGELDLLDGFDLVKHKPRLLLLEDNQRGTDPRLGDYMKTQPYIGVGWVEMSRIYIHKDEEAVIERARL